VTDISYQLPSLKPGGLTHLKWTASPQFDPRSTDYITSLSLRFSNQSRAQKPVSATPLWKGGNLRSGYDALHPAQQVMVPADAVKVELVTLLTGHGGVAPDELRRVLQSRTPVRHQRHGEAPELPRGDDADGLRRPGERGRGAEPARHLVPTGAVAGALALDVAPFVVDVTSEVRKGQPEHAHLRGAVRMGSRCRRTSGTSC
jgi:hypothetical protein